MQQNKSIKRKLRRDLSLEFELLQRHKKLLSSELHDNVSSKLSVVRFKLSHVNEEFVEVVDIIDKIIENVRRISHGLYSPAIEHTSLMEAIQDYLYPLHNIISIKIYNLHNRTYNLNTRTKLFLFRIFQEVINNSLKHSYADQVTVCIRYSKKFLSLSVKDDGIGFNYNLNNKKGIGLKNIKYRARKLKARYKFKTEINKGTLFIISVPNL